MEISKGDKLKCYEYLLEFEKVIKKDFGSYDINNKKLQRFLSSNKILLGGLNKSCKAEAVKFSYYILYEQRKPVNKANDTVHHLLRHIRNAVAHGHLEKSGKDKFKLKDFGKSNSLTMDGIIGKKLFFELLDLLKQAK